MQFPDVGMHWTEGGPDYTSPDYLSDWAHWTQVFSETLRNWCQSITAWNLALDEKGRPNIGPFPCGGIVTIHSETNEITRSGQFWALAHFSKFIRRGAKRLDSKSDAQAIHHVMVENPDGSRVVVFANSADGRSVTVQMGDATRNLTWRRTRWPPSPGIEAGQEKQELGDQRHRKPSPDSPFRLPFGPGCQRLPAMKLRLLVGIILFSIRGPCRGNDACPANADARQPGPQPQFRTSRAGLSSSYSRCNHW